MQTDADLGISRGEGGISKILPAFFLGRPN